MDLDELRKEIDAVDRQIVALFEKRMEISERIAAYKQKVGMQVRMKSGSRRRSVRCRILPTPNSTGSILRNSILYLYL